jgi:hypothetical protein
MGIPREMEDCEIVGPVILNPCSQCKVKTTLFPKILGTVEITEVFQIEMWKDKEGKYNILFDVNLEPMKLGTHSHEQWDYNDFAKCDGFKSADDMFKWFDKKYGLEQPKLFEVRRWIWL